MLESHLDFGLKLLREYPDNETKQVDQRKYVMCMTKNRAIADILGVPSDTDTSMIVRGTNAFRGLLHHTSQRIAKLGYLEQYTGYLLSQGYSSKHISNVLYGQASNLNSVENNITRLGASLMEHNYIQERGQGAIIRALGRDAAHEIRGFIFPIYPWPIDLESRA